MPKILIVDDRAINRDLLLALLVPSGYQVIEASDGVEGLKLAETQRPDLIITDLNMPVMTGDEFIENLQTDPALASIPVIIHTALSHEVNDYRYKRFRQVFDVLIKPTPPEEVLAAVQRAVGFTTVQSNPQHSRPPGTQADHLASEHKIAALVEVILDLAQVRNPEPLLQVFCDRSRKLVGARSSAVIIVDGTGKAVRHFAFSGLNSDFQPPIRADLISPLLSSVLREGRSIRLRNVKATELAFPDTLGRSEVPSLLNVPIQTPEKTYGELRFTDKIDAEEFSAEDERLSLTLAAQLGLSIENLARFDELQRYSLQLEEEIGERKAAEAALEKERDRQLRLKDEFLSHVSHELRSPLSAIHQFTTILLDGLAGGLNPDQHQYLSIILRNSDQLGTMIEDLLTVTRAESGKLQIHLEQMDAAALLATTVAEHQAEASLKGILLRSEIPPDLPPVWADPERTRQVWVNLIDNAIKFTPKGGIVSARVGVFDENPNFLMVSVADTGCGIKPENLGLIFERLYQESSSDESRKGFGLGLFIAHELVCRQNGRIWATSEVGSGSTFCFTLPVFSLSRIIGPVLTSGNLSDGGDLVLVTAQISPGPEHSPVTLVEKHTVDIARTILEHTVNPQSEMVLPRLVPATFERTIYVLANTDSAGAQRLTDRIREQLNSSQDFAEGGLEPEVSFCKLGCTPGADGRLLSVELEEIAARIEQIVQEPQKEHMK